MQGQAVRDRRNFNPRLHAGGDRWAPAHRSSKWHFNPRLHAGGDLDTTPAALMGWISIHASTREATWSGSTPPCCARYFNPRLHAGGDSRPRPKPATGLNFNPRLHAGGDAIALISSSIDLYFNPRLHAGGDGTGSWILQSPWAFQSTPPRGRRLGVRVHRHIGHDISIHASTREATSRKVKGSCGRRISIHASTREATSRPRPKPATGLNFNPRLHAGGDDANGKLHNEVLISIHASTREATGTLLPNPADRGISIHASTREATCDHDRRNRQARFQSTPPRGRRPATTNRQPGFGTNFNPRLHAGGDDFSWAPMMNPRISIHASTREATRPLRYKP